MEELEDFIKKHPVLFYGYIGICCLTMLLILTGKYGINFFIAWIGIFFLIGFVPVFMMWLFFIIFPDDSK